MLVFKILNCIKLMNFYFWLRIFMWEKNRLEDGLRKYGCYFNSIFLCGVFLVVYI